MVLLRSSAAEKCARCQKFFTRENLLWSGKERCVSPDDGTILGVKDQSIIDWLNALGSKAPTPGGGAVAGLNGAIATAQLKMVCEYTKSELPIVDLNQTILKFLKLAEQDSQAYLEIKSAYKSKDSGLIQKALLNATQPSEEIAKNCQEIYDFCHKNIEAFNKNLLSDLVVSLANLSAAVEAAQAILTVNAKAMDNAENQAATLAKIKFCDELISQITNLKNAVKERIA